MSEQETFELWGVALPEVDGFINPGHVMYASGREGAEHKAGVYNQARPSGMTRFVVVHCRTTEWTVTT